jgi:hypothetical protein
MTTKYAEMRKQCEAGKIIKIEDGIEVCGLNKMHKCSGYSCPSKTYWNRGGSQEGYHKMKALEQTGLSAQFKEEMDEAI